MMTSSIFDQVFGTTNSLLSELKEVLAHGTYAEKVIALSRVKLWRQFMLAHLNRLQGKLRFSPEQWDMLLTYLLHSPEYRQKLLAAKEEMETHKNDLSK